MQKIYRNTLTGKEIVDLSGKKTLTQIKKEFEDTDYEQLTINETTEGHEVKNGKLEKYSLAEEIQQVKAEREVKKQTRRIKVKNKMVLTDEQLDVLTEAIKEGI